MCVGGDLCQSLRYIWVFGDKNGNGLINGQLDAENSAALFYSQQFSADSNTGLWARSGLPMKICNPTMSSSSALTVWMCFHVDYLLGPRLTWDSVHKRVRKGNRWFSRGCGWKKDPLSVWVDRVMNSWWSPDPLLCVRPPVVWSHFICKIVFINEKATETFRDIGPHSPL